MSQTHKFILMVALEEKPVADPYHECQCQPRATPAALLKMEERLFFV